MKKNFTLKFLRIRIRNRAHARARTRILMFLTCTIICDINASQHGADLEGPVLIHMYTLFYAHVFIIPIRSYYIYTYCNSLLLCMRARRNAYKPNHYRAPKYETTALELPTPSTARVTSQYTHSFINCERRQSAYSYT